jgi:phosphoribosylformylglycinamidine synthase
VGCTDCLNFGSPQDPEIMWQFAEVVKGMAHACRELGIPVISGNVSLYNESPSRAIDPTPIVGMVGLMEPVKEGKALKLRPLTQWFKSPGDAVYLAGKNLDELGGSEYLQFLHSAKAGLPPKIDLKSEKALHQFLVAAARAGLPASAHDVSDGGLAVALAESCVSGGRLGLEMLGAEIRLDDPIRPDALLFGETQSRAVLSCDPGKAPALEKLARKHKVPLKRIGTVAVGGLRLRAEGSGESVDLECPVSAMKKAFSKTFEVMS